MESTSPILSDDKHGLLNGMKSKVSSASPIVAYASFAFTLVGLAVNFGYSNASMQGELATLKYQVTRNREETLDRVKSIEANVGNIYTSLSAIHSIKTDVEVIKVQIQSINETMRKLERQTRSPQK